MGLFDPPDPEDQEGKSFQEVTALDPFQPPDTEDQEGKSFQEVTGGSSVSSDEKDDAPADETRNVVGSDSTDDSDDEDDGGDGVLASITGAKEWAESEDAAKIRKRNQEAREEGGVTGALQQFDNSVRAGLDFVLDNPNASVQDASREGVEAATGVESEDQGEAAQDLAQDIDKAVKTPGRVVGEATEGTAVDNEAVGFLAEKGGAAGQFGLDAFVSDPAQAVVRGGTGIDTDTGDTEGTVGAVDAFDIGVTVGTAGVGSAGVSALRGASKSDEGARTFDELIGGGDDATKATDQVGASQRQVDEALSGSDEAAQAGDDSADLGTDRFGRLTEDGATASDEGAAGGVAGTVEETANRGRKFVDDLLGGSDDAAKVSDEGAQTGDEAGGLLSSQRAKAGAVGGIATVGAVGGATMNEWLKNEDQIELAGGDTLIRADTLRPTEDTPEGATMWRVVRKDGQEAGYTVVIGTQGRNVVRLDGNGNKTRSKVDLQTWKDAKRRQTPDAAQQGGEA